MPPIRKASPPLIDVRLKTPGVGGASPSAPPSRPAAGPNAPQGWSPANRVRAETNTPVGQIQNAAAELRAEAGKAVSDIASVSVAAAKTNPLEMMKLLKSGEVELSLPLKPGTLLSGSIALGGNQVGPSLTALEVKEPTELKIRAKVVDGKLVPSQSSVEFNPPLKGPLWGKIEGLRFTDAGQAKVSVKGMPDPSVGPPVSMDMKELAQQLQRAQSRGTTDVSILGIKLASAEIPGTTDAALSLAERVLAPGGSKIDVKNVELQGGEISLGTAGGVKLAPGSKLEAHGSLTDLQLSGHVELAEVNLHKDGLLLKGSAGSADLNVQFKKGPDGKPQVSAQLDHLNIKTDYAVTQRSNGDFIEMAQGQLKDGSIRLDEVLSPGGASVASVKVNQFDGKLKRAQLTVADGDGTATVRVKDSTVSGSFEIDDDRIALRGTLGQVDASIEGYQGQVAGATADVQRLSLQGSATLAMDSKAGTLNFEGRGQVDAQVKNMKLGSAGVSLEAGASQLSGTAKASFDARKGVQLTGDLKLTASLEDAKIELPGIGQFDVKRGSTVDGTLKQIAFGPDGARANLVNARVNAELDRGSVQLPGGGKVDVTKAQVGFTFNELSASTSGIPTARGSMELEARVSERDLRNVRLPGVTLGSVSSGSQSIKMKLGDFSIASDGNFEASKLTFAVTGEVDRFSGRITLPGTSATPRR